MDSSNCSKEYELSELQYAQRLVNEGLSMQEAYDLIERMKQNGHKFGVVKAKILSKPKKVDSKLIVKEKSTKKPKPLTKREKAIVEVGVKIDSEPPKPNDLTFMHSMMCQVGLPRKKVDSLEFERVCGNAGVSLRAGKVWDGKQFVQQQLPYGTIPRLIMTYLNTSALRHKSPIVEVGGTTGQFMKRLGMSLTGGKTGTYTAFRKQMQALAACEITFGLTTATKAITYNGSPIKKFDAWLSNTEEHPALWPAEIQFSQEYYETLINHAVPLDLRAMEALSGSALAMDIYAMLAERLHRISGRPVILHWKNLREQFGQEYRDPKNFKQAFLKQLKSAQAVYPKAKVKQVTGGIMMMASPPPIPYKNS